MMRKVQITKAGDSYLRSLLVLGASGMLGNAVLRWFAQGDTLGTRYLPGSRQNSVLNRMAGISDPVGKAKSVHLSEEGARMCFARLAHKMPVKVRFLRRRPV